MAIMQQNKVQGMAGSARQVQANHKLDGTPRTKSQTTVLARFVREYLEGEVPNGKDDNGNGLVDEMGLSFDSIGMVWTVRLTLERRDANGNLCTQTVQTAVKMRN